MASPIFLEIGSIIEINAPNNENLHNNIYYIDYLDQDKIKLTNPIKNQVLTLSNGKIDDESIQNITILSKPKEKGYAKIEKLLPNSWIEIYFNGDVPIIITGKITDLFEDTIEVTIYPSNEVIYIDFEYKGILDKYNIKKIVKRDPPDEIKRGEMTIEQQETEPTDKEEEEFDEEEIATIEEIGNIDYVVPEEKLKEILLSGDIQFEGALEEITQKIDVADYEKRYDITIQTNDLLDEFLAKIPTYKRNRKVLNEIHILIERYKQLRDTFSNFDENDNIIGSKIKGHTHKPLVESLKHLKNKIKWILPVSTYEKKLYGVGGVISDYPDANGDAILYDEQEEIEQLLKEIKLIENFSKNKLPPNDSNLKYLLNGLLEYQTPYENTSSVENILDEVTTHTSLDLVINNSNNFESTVINRSRVGSKQFMLQNYNIGLKGVKPKPFKNSQSVQYLITPNDKPIITSLLTLPYEVMKYSNINLPGTNILDKSILNIIPFNYSLFLNNKTNVETSIINDLDDKLNFNNMLENVKNIKFTEDIENDNKYSNYLQKTIPSNKKFFNLIKDQIKESYSIQSVVEHLQPFLIYFNDISFKNYEVINKFIQENIENYKINLVKQQSLFQNEIIKKFNIKYDYPILFKHIDDSLYEKIKNKYKLNTKKLVNSEILKNIIISDNGSLFNSVISFKNRDLFSNVNIEQEVTTMLSNNNEIPEVKDDACKKYVLSKKYIDIEDLNEDNNKTIYYDKKYDFTDYDIISCYPKNEMTDEQYKEYVALKLQENIGLSIEKAREDAETMITGKKRVKNGDYAVLETYENDNFNSTYYVRKDNKWELDETITKDTFMTNNKSICNSQKDCLSFDNQCVSDNNKLYSENELLEKIKQSLDNNFYENKKNYANYIKKIVDKESERLYLIKTIQKANELKYDLNKVKIGNRAEIKDIVVSPHQKLLNLILGQSDFVKKQNNILQFANNYCVPGENVNFLYCKDTNTPLLPAFLSVLANGFIDGIYNQVLDEIIKLNGELSESGDYWVDKFSGYYICPISLAQEEEYTAEGFKIVSHSVIEEGVSHNIFGKQKNIISQENKYILNIVNAMSSYIGISVASQEQFIMKHVLNELKKNIPSKETYEKKIATLKNKKIPTYDYVFNNALVKYTLCYFLIALQTMIPSVKTRKTFPGCVRSFIGYPFYNKTDMSALKYIACVSSKLKNKYPPWNAIIKEKEESIFKSLNSIMDKIINNLSEKLDLNNKFKEKEQYLRLYKESEIIPESHSITSWNTFLPPLQLINVGKINSFSKDFLDSLEENIRTNNSQQTMQLFSIRGKIFNYSLSILESIQEVVNKEDVLLKTMNNVPYLENACCNVGEKYTLPYFVQKEPSINIHNKKVIELGNLLKKYNKMHKSPFFYDPTNTKLVYPSLSNKFSEETIYKAFIDFCNFNKNVPIPESLKAVCTTNKSAFDNFDNLSRKIQILKQEGRNYTLSEFNILLNIINKQNLVNIKLNITLESPREMLNNNLLFLQSKEDSIVPTELLENILELNDNYDTFVVNETFEPLKNIRDYIGEQSENYKRQIVNFIKNRSNANQRFKKKAISYLQNLDTMNKIEQNITLSLDDLNNEKISDFLKNQIIQMSIIIPIKILNNVTEYNQPVPEHWNLSSKHVEDIENIISKTYLPFKKFYSNTKLESLLEKMVKQSKDLLRLLDSFPFQGRLKTLKSDTTTLFNSEINKEFTIYSFLFILIKFIKLTNEKNLVPKEKLQKDVYSATNVEVQEETLGEISEVEVVTGLTRELQGIVADFIVTLLDYFSDQKNVIDLNKEIIMSKVLRSKEKEKEEVTTYFENMSDEEREIEKLFKNNKLGKWSLGLGKGIFAYVADVYEDERKAIEDRAILEKKIGVSSDVTQANAEIYMLEAQMEALSNQFADNEAYDMSMQMEDDNPPENMDGDEMFY